MRAANRAAHAGLCRKGARDHGRCATAETSCVCARLRPESRHYIHSFGYPDPSCRLWRVTRLVGAEHANRERRPAMRKVGSLAVHVFGTPTLRSCAAWPGLCRAAGLDRREVPIIYTSNSGRAPRVEFGPAAAVPSALHSMVATTVPNVEGSVVFLISLRQGAPRLLEHPSGRHQRASADKFAPTPVRRIVELEPVRQQLQWLREVIRHHIDYFGVQRIAHDRHTQRRHVHPQLMRLSRPWRQPVQPVAQMLHQRFRIRLPRFFHRL